MYTNNTIKKKLAMVGKAIESLEIISNELNLSIIKFLKNHSEVNFFQLQNETGLSFTQLEKRLLALSKNEIIQIKNCTLEKRYALNHYKLLSIQLMTKALVQQAIKV